MKKKLLVIYILGCITLSGSPAEAQNKESLQLWKIVAESKFRGLKGVKFSDNLLALNGKPVMVAGYLYPLKSGYWHNHFVLSALPTRACYFCGVGGPETIIEVFSEQKVMYKEEMILIKGILRVNREDNSKLPVIIEKAYDY